MRQLLMAFASSTVIACGGSPPSPPVVTPPSGGETINGSERIGWDQPAADAVELAAIRYAIYVDGARSELTSVSCAPSTSAARFSCTAPLPSLTRGAHTLQIASFVVDGSTLESARSAALDVTVATLVTSAQPPAPSDRRGESPSHVTARAPVETVLDRTETPVDLAIAPDGRLFVAERSGRIRIVGDRGGSSPEAASVAQLLGGARLLALALDPQFARTHLLYVLFTAAAPASAARTGVSAAEEFAIARLRESDGTLGDAVVVLDRVRASASPAGALRFGPDGKLYAAFDAGGNANASGDPASYNGKVLRINTDGTTPSDQPRASPVFAADFVAPAGLAWDSAGTLWVADRRSSGPGQLRAVAAKAPGPYALPAGAAPTGIVASLAPARDVVIGADSGGGLLLVRIDGASGRPLGVERLLRDSGDAVRALAIAPDGAIVFATDSRVLRLADRRTQQNQ